MPSCFVPSCKNSDKLKKPGISYHSFPKRLTVEWLQAIGRDPQTFIIQQRVCSEHFLNEDFELIGLLKKLKPDVIPSVNLPAPRPIPVASQSQAIPEASTSQVMPKALISSETASDPVLVAPDEVPKLVAVREYLESLPNESEMIQLRDEAPADQAIPSSPSLVAISASSDSGSQEGASSFVIPAKRRLFESDTSAKTSATMSPPRDPPLKRPKTVVGSSTEKSKSSASLGTKKRMVKTFHPYSHSPEHYKKQIKKHEEELLYYKRKYHNAARTSSRRRIKIINLKSVLVLLEKQCMLSGDALTVLENTFEGVPLALMKRMIKNSKTKGGRSKSAYPQELKSFAMTLQFYNCKAYDYVRNTFELALPAQSTLRAWFSKVECTPGISKPSIDQLKITAEEYFNKNGKPLLLSFMLDEMSIKKEIISEKNTQNVWGYVDFGADIQYSNTQEVATEALVLMVVGVNLNFKLPVAYFFINKLNGEEKANVIKETLHHLNLPHVKVLSITCDGPHVNFKMMSELGCQVTDPDDFKTYFENPATGDKIYVLFDICHMLKLVRNNWATAGTLLDPEGQAIKWDYVCRLHMLQENQGLYLGNKIRNRHMQWQKAIMKVNLAAQTLSASVADALEFLSKDLMLDEFKGAEATIKFIREFDKLFDLLNSRNPYGRGMKTPMKEVNENYWKPFLEETIQYILHLTNTSGTPLYKTTRKVPYLGFAVSSISLLQIYKDQVQDEQNLKYILTYKFSQDHLELFFCSIRSRNGWNNNPNCLQFMRTYKRLLLHQAVRKDTGNCIAQDQTNILTVSSTRKKLEMTDVHLDRIADNEEAEKLEEKIQLFLPVHLDEFAENVIAYIAGFVIRVVERKVKCPECREAMRFSDADECDVTLKLIMRKSRGGLLLPSISLREVCKVVERKLQIIMKVEGAIPAKTALIDTLLRESPKLLFNDNLFPTLRDHCFDFDVLETSHKKILIHDIIKSYSGIRINSLARNVNETISGVKVRKTLNKLILFKHQ